MNHGEHEKAANTEHTPEPMHDEIWLQCPNRDSMSEWYGEVTWSEDQINDDDTKYVRADIAESLMKQRDELLAAMELLVAGIENSVSETFIPLVKARAALASVKGGAA